MIEILKVKKILMAMILGMTVISANDCDKVWLELETKNKTLQTQLDKKWYSQAKLTLGEVRFAAGKVMVQCKGDRKERAKSVLSSGYQLQQLLNTK